MEPVLWLVLGLTTITCGFLASGRPRALQVGRTALGLLMLVGGAVVNGYYLATGVDYGDFADQSMLSFVTNTWRSVVAPHQGAFIGLLIVFEAVVGVLVLLGGRAAAVGMIGILGFHVGLMSFGWVFWVWSVPMLVGVTLLLRAQLIDLRQTRPAASFPVPPEVSERTGRL
ncbi:MAG: hypothetical protein ACJ72Y_00640 [Actinomycetes bacterium]